MHRAQLLATDVDGQSTLSPPVQLQIDAGIPTRQDHALAGGRAVTVRVSDAYSASTRGAITVSFGDGRRARGRRQFKHTYAHAGVYRITVHVRDKLGNAGVVRELVSVR